MGGIALPAGFSYWEHASGTFPACYCTIQWLTAAEKLGLATGLIKYNLDIVQLMGNAEKSAGVHAFGAAFDVKQRSDAWIRIYRKMGARATWRREGGEWIGNEHAHGAIACAHDREVEYQILAQRRGYNGLGQAKDGPYKGMWGYGGPDPHPNPDTDFTWQEGIAWANAEVKRLTTKPAPTPVSLDPFEEIMALSDAEKNDLARLFADEVWRRKAGGNPATLDLHVLNANVKAGSNGHALKRIELALARIEAAVSDPAGLALELSKHLPDDVTVTQDMLNAAVLNAYSEAFAPAPDDIKAA